MESQPANSQYAQDSLAWIGLGSNAGNMLQNLTQAALDLSTLPASSMIAASSIFSTKAVGEGYSSPFLNAVIGLRTSLKPHVLLKYCQEIEIRLGRDRKNKDRTLDVDILLFGDLILSDTNLKIPHPHMLSRRFVLEPLSQIAGDLVHPKEQTTIVELLKNPEVQGQDVERLDQPLLPVWGC
jgi:2-amino-4-hydroxy-6-hydroxymethyldihydropteridine diphosphokinase